MYRKLDNTVREIRQSKIDSNHWYIRDELYLPMKLLLSIYKRKCSYIVIE